MPIDRNLEYTMFLGIFTLHVHTCPLAEYEGGSSCQYVYLDNTIGVQSASERTPNAGQATTVCHEGPGNVQPHWFLSLLLIGSYILEVSARGLLDSQWHSLKNAVQMHCIAKCILTDCLRVPGHQRAADYRKMS